MRRPVRRVGQMLRRGAGVSIHDSEPKRSSQPVRFVHQRRQILDHLRQTRRAHGETDGMRNQTLELERRDLANVETANVETANVETERNRSTHLSRAALVAAFCTTACASQVDVSRTNDVEKGLAPDNVAVLRYDRGPFKDHEFALSFEHCGNPAAASLSIRGPSLQGSDIKARHIDIGVGHVVTRRRFYFGLSEAQQIILSSLPGYQAPPAGPPFSLLPRQVIQWNLVVVWDPPGSEHPDEEQASAYVQAHVPYTWSQKLLGPSIPYEIELCLLTE